MASDLDLLIDHYQWEIIRLKSSIKENLEMHFYREVEFDEKALREVQRELDRLLEFKNPNYPEIKRLESQIVFFENMRKERSSMAFYYEGQINEVKEKLDALKKEIPSQCIFETQFLDDAIFKLVQGELSSFKLHLDIENSHYLRISPKEENRVQVSIFVSSEDINWLLQNSIIKDLGFIKDPNGEKLDYVFKLTSIKNILPLKELLSRIVVVLRADLRHQNTVNLELIKK
jgi:hypothetical protein